MEPTADHLEFDGLEPGTYRLFDTLSARASEERQIAGGDVVESRFDLRGVVIVKGRIVVPEGAEVRSVRFERTEVGETPGALRGIVYAGAPRVNADGTWEARVPGDRPVLLHFRHPALVAAEGMSPLRVTGPPAEEPVIEFVAGAEAVITVPGPRQSYPVQVLLFRGEVAGEPVARIAAYLEEDGARYRVRGIVPGTWTLWIDAPGYVPLVLRDVELPAGTSDLGAPAFSRGTTLRVRLRLPEGRDAPRVYVSAVCEAEPRYWRSLNSGGGIELVLPGLGAGTFEVRCRPVMGGVTPDEITRRTITVDGRNDVELVFEME